MRPQETYDLIVIGGGVAGTVAAIAAARNGCKTALVQDRPVLGGNSSSEMRINITGARAGGRNPHARETGIIEELRLEDRFRDPRPGPVNGQPNPQWDWILWEWVRRESNLTLYLNTRATEPIMADKEHIKGIIVEQYSTERRFRLDGALFIDASGDGEIAAKAGASFLMGREARNEFGESYAPQEADDKVLPPSILFSARDEGRPVKFVPPPWIVEYRDDDALPYRPHGRIGSGFWWIAWGGELDPIKDSEEIRDELLRHVFGVWDHIKNHGDHGAETFALDWVGAIPAKRESRRFLGDHILTQDDLESQKLFPDRVAYGGWPIDLHPPEGIKSPDPPCTQYQLPGIYSVPFRSLYSRDIHNLMFAGRNISATHVAFGSIRVMGTCAVMGQAVGTAAALCKRYGLTPRELAQQRIGELQQQLLKDDCYIIDMANTDPADLARQAKVTASSEAPLEVPEPTSWLPLDVDRGQMITLSHDRLEALEVLLRSYRDVPLVITAYLRKGKNLTDFTSIKDLAKASATVEPGESWVTFRFEIEVEPGSCYWVLLPATEGVEWAISSMEPYALQRAEWSMDYRRFQSVRQSHVLRAMPRPYPYSPANVISGVSRPERGPNIWISDPGQPLPQWIELNWSTPQIFNTVYLTFDTNCNDLVPTGPAPECVRDYHLQALIRDEWQELSHMTENHQRRNVLRFESIVTKRLRVTIRATNGVPEARIYEIRVYKEV